MRLIALLAALMLAAPAAAKDPEALFLPAPLLPPIVQDQSEKAQLLRALLDLEAQLARETNAEKRDALFNAIRLVLGGPKTDG